MAVSNLSIVQLANSQPADPSQPPLVLVGDRGSKITLPFAPLPVTHARGMAWDTVDLDGRGRAPLLLEGNATLRTLTFTVTIAKPDNQADIEALLTALSNAAEGTERWTVSYGPQEAGLWRFTSFQYDITQRQHLTNLATVATSQITLTDAGRTTVLQPSPWKAPPPPPKTTTATPAPPPKGTTGQVNAFYASLQKNPGAAAYFQQMAALQNTIKPDASRPKTYTVKAGDTLTALAVKFYGNTKYYALIGCINGITNPALIRTGQVLKLP